MRDHESKVESICNQIAAGQNVFALEKHCSNGMRTTDYKNGHPFIPLNQLNRVILIDRSRHILLAEPRVTMDQLHQAALKEGFIIPILPEFKGITVGGAVMGAAIESSSFRLGQFNDICTGYEIILGNGDKVWASKEQNPDLFYAIPGSYGSLGILTLIEIQIIPKKDWVKLNYHPVRSAHEAIDCLCSLKSADYLEGIIFSPQQAVVIEGTRVERISKEQKLSLEHYWSPWFYQHAKLKTSPSSEVISITDYLFRHDRGAFWMGSYATHLELSMRYLLEGFLQLPMSAWKTHFSGIKDPGAIFRALLGWIMPSKRLYSLLHSGTEHWFESKFVIQDFYIPEDKASGFLEETMKKEGIFPIWLCPVLASPQPQLFSPHYLPSGNEHNLIDIGIYGMPHSHVSIPETTKRLEQSTRKHGGRKMLYSHNYYTPEEFWRIYSKSEYLTLRKKYQAEGTLHSIEEKVLLG